MKMIDLTGQTFGYLTVLRFVGKAKNGASIFRCRCRCGIEKDVLGANLKLSKRATKSCGKCWKIDHPTRPTTHGQTRSPTYSSWQSMKSRCYNKNNSEYHRYGGRGIIVCDRWLGKKGFANFFTDMGERPSIDYTIDRYPNVNGNYMPSNCRWATHEEQNHNKRNTVFIEFEGKQQPFNLLCKKLNINPRTAKARLNAGFSTDQVFSTEKLGCWCRPTKKDRLISFRGETKRVVDWAEETGLKAGTIYARLNRGGSAEKTLTTPT